MDGWSLIGRNTLVKGEGLLFMAIPPYPHHFSHLRVKHEGVHMSSRRRRSYTRQQLQVRWWTDEDIDNILGEPDEFSGAAHPSLPDVPRWGWSRVHRAEQSEAFRTQHHDVFVRLGEDERQARIQNFLMNMQVEMTEPISIGKLVQELHPTRKTSRGPEMTSVRVVNYVRHQHTNYDSLLVKAKQQGISGDVYEPLVRAVTQAVVTRLPELHRPAMQFLSRKFR
jgi:hypothetical protein